MNLGLQSLACKGKIWAKKYSLWSQNILLLFKEIEGVPWGKNIEIEENW
jgi:hypothetical protein